MTPLQNSYALLRIGGEHDKLFDLAQTALRVWE